MGGKSPVFFFAFAIPSFGHHFVETFRTPLLAFNPESVKRYKNRKRNKYIPGKAGNKGKYHKQSRAYPVNN